MKTLKAAEVTYLSPMFPIIGATKRTGRHEQCLDTLDI